MRRAAWLGLFGLVACGEGSRDPGLDAWLRVSGAQYVRGAPPADGAGPAITTLQVSRNAIARGAPGIQVSGSMAPEANAVAIALEGDVGHWVMPAGPPDAFEPGLLTFGSTAQLGVQAPLGARELSVVAVSADGEPGRAARTTLEIGDVARASGAFVVTLTWDTVADLDLHVVTPDGVELWARRPIAAGGRLDFDAASQCAGDGRREENAIWASKPTPGRWVARVDAFSLCGADAARWRVEARLEGALLAEAEGVATAAATRGPHVLGAGITALEVDVP